MSAPDPTGLGEDLKRAADAASPRPVDVDAVLAASRSRRRARRTAVVTGAGAVAAVLAVGGLVFGLQRTGGGATTADAPIASESAGSAETAPEIASGESADDTAGLRLAAPETVNRCGAAVVPLADAADAPLAVSVVPPIGQVPPGGTAAVTVTVTNTGSEVVTGVLSRVPAITVAEADVVAWHSSGTSEAGATDVSLQPGEAVTLTGMLSAMRCTAADDGGTGLPPDLPPLAPGPYVLSATVAFSTPAEGMVLLLSSPFVPLSIG
jgi:hypothetical protein